MACITRIYQCGFTVYLSARNIQDVKMSTASALNTYNVLDAETIVLTEDSLKVMDGILSE